MGCNSLTSINCENTDLPIDQSFGDFFLNQGYFFLDASSLRQVDKNQTA